MSDELPPYAALVATLVEDVDRWKATFDDDEPNRRAAGILGHHINRAEDDPNLITLFLALSDLDKAEAFSQSPELGEAMQKAGVMAPPEITWLQPIREQVVWDRQLPAFILHHRVADFDSWLAGYDDADEIQKANGIIGHAANRSLDDPQMVTIYHQAESFDTLRSFLDNPDLQAAMEKAGVISEPEVTFHTGGWAKFY
jgi:quinol monooxygenase YgiN